MRTIYIEISFRYISSIKLRVCAGRSLYLISADESLNLLQVGAIALQNLSLLMQGIHECLENPDWATRKAAAETLSSLASNLPNLVAECASSTIASLESCRFDKVHYIMFAFLVGRLASIHAIS